MRIFDKLARYPIFALIFVAFAAWDLIDGEYGHAFLDALFAAYVFAYWRKTRWLTAENEALSAKNKRLGEALAAHHSAPLN